MHFAHLHVHTHYSILDGQSKIPDLISAAVADGQPALAITDHGNMFGVKEFVDTVKKMKAPLKPIIGSEMYVAHGSRLERKGREDQSSYHLILIAKNIQGYHNLIKLSSLSYIEGFYYKPRIDHELLEKYHEGLICSSACLGGEVPQAILQGRIEEAENIIKWHRDLFGDDYYLEVQRHKTDIPGAEQSTFGKQEIVNNELFRIAGKLGIKVIATNDVHFVRSEDGAAHDRLICISTNSDFDDPKRLRYTQQEYLKTTLQMSEIFHDHPEVISNTMEIVDKVEEINLDHDPILPVFPLPEGFDDSNAYLRSLTYEGAGKRYGLEIGPEKKERIDFELATIEKMGFPDYFLIVQDFISEARKEGVWVGPGRGSAAGSVVAYCLGITNIDPFKYDLLFERFLNPDRISMPDIDIDFDDEGRYKVFEYVENKYGKDHVSHVITFGTMATKSVIKDVGRIQKISLSETDRLSKLVPRKISVSRKVETDDPEHPGHKIFVTETKDEDPTIGLCIEKVPEFKQAMESGDELLVDMLKYAGKLEGTVRNTGVHACATIIGRDDLTNFIPLSTAKDKDSGKDILVSQFEGSLIESAGMLKMDFLGLKTLTILKDCVANIKKSRGEDVDINEIPIDDRETYELFARGDTVALFQFESEGMQKWLEELRPNRFEDLIAMNALYRPGPMKYIPDFVARKHGQKKIEYDLPEMEGILHDTYGVTVYQEQVMLLSQKLAGFTKGEADKLRKAMGKKQVKVMAELKGKFFEGGLANGHPEEILNKIWNDWLSFAEYAFNKSHATCYAWVGYQTGYLKAHYPAEYMAAVLSNNLNDISKLSKYMEDCRKMQLKVLGPDINESFTKFTVNKDGNIRFGMAGIKGVGESAVNSIIEAREKNGPFTDIFNFIERANLATVNKKAMESLAYSGAFDCFTEITRGSFAMDAGKGDTFLDLLIKYGNRFQKDEESIKNSLFGESGTIETARPPLPVSTLLDQTELLKREKDLVGMYLSAHPLDKYRFEIEHLTTINISDLAAAADAAMQDRSLMGRKFIIAGLVGNVDRRTKQNGSGEWCRFTMEDFSSSIGFALFDKNYEKFMGFLNPHECLIMEVALCPRKRFPSKEEAAKLKAHGIKPEPEIVGCEARVRSVSLLSTARESMIKEFIIELPLGKISNSFRKGLKGALRKSKGNTMLTLNIIDTEHSLNVEMFSRKYTVFPSNDLISFLDVNGIRYKVIRRESL